MSHMTPSSALSLPNELYLEIAKRFDFPEDLLAWARVNTKFMALAQSELFHDTWVGLRENYPIAAIPSPQSRFSELQWAFFVFGNGTCEVRDICDAWFCNLKFDLETQICGETLPAHVLKESFALLYEVCEQVRFQHHS